MGELTEDGLIDCTGFEDLGVPSPLECWKHQAHALASEVGDLQKDLSTARRNIHKLVRMYADTAKERDALRLDVIELKWRVSDMLRESGMEAGRQMNYYDGAHRHHDGK